MESGLSRPYGSLKSGDMGLVVGQIDQCGAAVVGSFNLSGYVRKICAHREVPNYAKLAGPTNEGSTAPQGFFKHKPTVVDVPHFAPSGAPPLGQKTDTRVSLDSQLTDPSA